MNPIKKLRFVIWRWYFLRFRLPRIARESSNEIRQEYQEYRRESETELSFAEWCGTQVEDK